MKLIPMLCFCCAVIVCGGEYGKKLPLKRIPGVDEGAMATALYRNTLWVAGSRGTLFAFDVSEPRTPKFVSKLRVMKNCRQMAVRNGIAAVVGRQNGMVLVDIRNPGSPRLLSRYQ